jgi:hypothetical protein
LAEGLEEAEKIGRTNLAQLEIRDNNNIQHKDRSRINDVLKRNGMNQ